jgi:hypothetical protein
MTAGQVAAGDLIPIIDVDATTSPTGESKAITAAGLSDWLANSGILDANLPFQGFQTSNGLYFDETVEPTGDINKYCYAPFQNLGDDFTLYVRGFIPSDSVKYAGHRTIFGVGQHPATVALTPPHALIAMDGDNLVGVVNDNLDPPAHLTVPGFFASGGFSGSADKAFSVCLTKNSIGDVRLYVNGTYSVLTATSISSITNTYLTMGCGHNGGGVPNINCTIYEAHVFDVALTSAQVMQLFYRGASKLQSGSIASYNPENLNPGPTQWLDSVGNKHLLLPTVGASATNPDRTFNLCFTATASGYLGDATERVVLPNKYVLTSCVVESPGKPLLSVGTSDLVSPVSSSGTSSWNDNRVPLTSASYGVNPLGLLPLGVAHVEKTIYVAFSGSASPCTFSFEGYVRT